MLAAKTVGSVSVTIGSSCVMAALVCSGTETAPADAQRDVDGRVVDAGEAEYADSVTGADQPVGQSAGHLADAVGQLAVGDFVEPGQQRGGGAPGLRVCHQLIRPLRQRGPVGVTLQHGLDDRGEVRPGGHRWRR